MRVGDAAAVDRAGRRSRPSSAAAAAEATAKMTAELTDGSVAVVVPDGLVEEISAALTAAGIEHGRATRTGLDDPVTVVPVSVVKGLELDGVVVVEPARIVSDEVQGLRALYVALTRPTQRLTVVHAADLPPPLQPDAMAMSARSRSSLIGDGARRVSRAGRGTRAGRPRRPPGPAASTSGRGPRARRPRRRTARPTGGPAPRRR